MKKYFLGGKYRHIYFTQREVECVIMLLKGKTKKIAAKKLSLSTQTVEFYLQNVKVKMGCYDEAKLIKLIKATDLLKKIDFAR